MELNTLPSNTPLIDWYVLIFRDKGILLVQKNGNVTAIAYVGPDADMGGSYIDIARAVEGINQHV